MGKKIRHSNDEEDLLHDVFVVLAHQISRFKYRRNGRIRGWLFTIIKNKNTQRHRGKLKSLINGNGEALNGLHQDDPIPDWIETDYRRMIIQRVMELIQSHFPEMHWKAFSETHIKGRSPKEVAEELRAALDTVYRVCKKVLRYLQRELDGLLD